MENEKIICPHCGRAIPWDSMFCPYCGHTLYVQEDSSSSKEETPQTSVTETRYKTKYRKKRKKDTGKIISFTVKAVIIIALILLGINVYSRYGDDVKGWISEKVSSVKDQGTAPAAPVTQPVQSEPETPVATPSPTPSEETTEQEDTSSQTEENTTESTDQGTE